MTAVTNTSSLKLRPWVTAAMLAGLIIVGTSTAIGASAQEPSVVVHYAASDLATTQGAHALYLRIAAAAQQVCGGRPNTTDPIAVAWSRGCQNYAIEQAVRAVGNPTLIALQTHGEMLAYRAQSGR